MNASISQGNTKMGAIKSISLPSIITCRPGCPCAKKCYAHKLERCRPTVKRAYQNNLDLLNLDSEKYWSDVRNAVSVSRFFRFHVGGDIYDYSYFEHMVDMSKEFPHCDMLCFTKKYELVNHYIDVNGELPRNLHVIFSAWVGLPMPNPYKLPEAHVRYRNGSTTASSEAKQCSGNCTHCAQINDGCWTLKRGEQVVFDEH